MPATTKLLLKKHENIILDSNRILIIDAPDNNTINYFIDTKKIDLLTIYSENIRNEFTSNNNIANNNIFNFKKFYSYDLIILYIPKGKKSQSMVIDLICSLLDDKGILIVTGKNDTGIKSIDKLLKPYLKNIYNSGSGYHCRTVYADTPIQKTNLHLDDWKYIWRFKLESDTLDICSLPGVFSFGKIDKGTLLLLKSLPDDIYGDVADVGCGSGLIGCLIAFNRKKVNVDMIDNNMMAVMASDESIKLNNLYNAKAYYGNGIVALEKNKYDFIFINPPFHKGTQTDYNFHKRISSESAVKLKKNGALYIVTNSFIDMEKLLKINFSKVFIYSRDNSYNVYKAEL